MCHNGSTSPHKTIKTLKRKIKGDNIVDKLTVIWMTIAVYIVAMALVSFFYSRKKSSVENFTVGKRNAGAWITAFSYGTAYFSAVMFVGYSGGSGWNYGIWSVLVGIGNALFGSFLAWKILASRTRSLSRGWDIKSMPQMFAIRFKSKGMKKFSAIVIFIFLLPYSASVYKGLASICSVLLGVDDKIAMIIIAVLSALLLITGGYLATIKADFMQGIIMVFGVSLLIFFVLRSDVVVQGGSFAGLWERMQQAGVEPMGSQKWVALLSTVLMTSFGTWGLPQMIHKYYGIKDEREIKRGTVISTLFALLVAGGGYLIGAFSHLFFTTEEFAAIGGADFAVPHILAKSNLPTILLGVVLVLLISASVSTLASVSLSASTTMSIDLIQPAAKGKIDDKKATWLMRGVCLVFVILSYVVANTDTPILDMMSYSWGVISGSFLAPYLLSLYHKGMTRPAAWIGMLGGFVTAMVPATAKIITLIAPHIGGLVAQLAAMGPQFAVGAMLFSFALCLVAAPITAKKGADTNSEFYTPLAK